MKKSNLKNKNRNEKSKNNWPILSLALETSCDDTALAILKHHSPTHHKIRAKATPSQYASHAPFGGVVPSLAARDHSINIPTLLPALWSQIPNLKPADLHHICYTATPGLAPCLLMGKTAAQMLAWAFNKPLIPVNHVQAHIASALMAPELNGRGYPLPAVALVISGGHTSLYLVNDYNHNVLLGQTLDDAAGEAFDKVARLLGLEQPGGPAIEKLAKTGDPKAFNFPRPMSKDDSLNFSFAGLKTAVLYKLRNLQKSGYGLQDTGYRLQNAGYRLQDTGYRTRADVAASFQLAVIDSVVAKVKLAATQHKAKSVLLVGGVAANQALRQTLNNLCQTLPQKPQFVVPPLALCTDNAVMVGVMGFLTSNLKLKTKNVKLKCKTRKLRPAGYAGVKPRGGHAAFRGFRTPLAKRGYGVRPEGRKVPWGPRPFTG